MEQILKILDPQSTCKPKLCGPSSSVAPNLDVFKSRHLNGMDWTSRWNLKITKRRWRGKGCKDKKTKAPCFQTLVWFPGVQANLGPSLWMDLTEAFRNVACQCGIRSEDAVCSVIRGEDRRASFTQSTSKMWPNAQGDVDKVMPRRLEISADWDQRPAIRNHKSNRVTGSHRESQGVTLHGLFMAQVAQLLLNCLVWKTLLGNLCVDCHMFMSFPPPGSQYNSGIFRSQRPACSAHGCGSSVALFYPMHCVAAVRLAVSGQ